MVLVLPENGEQNCSSFLGLGSKTNLSYYFARLGGSGLTLTRMASDAASVCIAATCHRSWAFVRRKER
jgi:hypothetical protein